MTMKPLANIHVVSLAGNLPGPVAVARLVEWGATAVKIEPPEGDAFSLARPGWYQPLHRGVEIRRLNLKDPAELLSLHALLNQADLLVTATRPQALARLGLSWSELTTRYPRLCQVAIVGYDAPRDGLPGHDLTYQARAGLVAPPDLPRTCIADLAGALEAAATGLALLLARERGRGGHYAQVSLGRAAEFFAEPLRHGLTSPGGPLGGGLPGYNLYRAKEGWIAVAALERHFVTKLLRELGLTDETAAALQSAFLTRSAAEWETWGAERDLPIAAVV
jgi:crotonobetainyl-CoA:carnitine CoA-transferase CaiB-like acyl-CoA transferase